MLPTSLAVSPASCITGSPASTSARTTPSPAAGNSGRLIAAELAARGLSVRLAGRRRGLLEDLARVLGADGATTDVRTVDVSDATSLAEAITDVGVVLSTIGPFARQAAPVIDACLAAGVSYVDIANEWAAVRGLLDRDEQARAHAVTLVTGAGFGRPRPRHWSCGWPGRWERCPTSYASQPLRR